MRRKLAKYPATIVTVAMLIAWAAVIALVALWPPFLWIALVVFVAVVLWSSIRTDRRAR